MSHRFLVDANLPERLVYLLRDAGHEARHVRSLRLREDKAIWETALAMDAAIVTQDADFLQFLVRDRRTKLVLDTKGNRPFATILEDIRKALPEIEEALLAGEKLIELI